VVGAAMNATDPHRRHVDYQPNPARRGTLNIIQSCFFTILACTWSIQRPNLPASTDGRPVRIKRRLLWTFVNILAPEFLLAHAVDHKIWAHETVKSLKKEGIEFLEEIGWLRSSWRRLRRWCAAFRCCGPRK